MKAIKISAMQWLMITTFLLLMVVLSVVFDFDVFVVFCLVVIGQGVLLFTVYKVLKEPYTTDKTFEDFYEDKPITKA